MSTPARHRRAAPRRKAEVKAKASKPSSAGAERFLIREVAPRDLDALYALSRHLDSVNFPHNKHHLRGLITRSRNSFGGKTKDVFRREYMFVLEGVESGTIAGTSMIFAQHGHPDAPHVFFDVIEDERYSLTLDRHFSHTMLRLGFHYRGPTEIGALVLDPRLRAFGLGKQLSYVRFLFIAMFRERFQRSVIAELMPPLLPDGTSLLWEHLGRHFTGLTYQEADKLSHANKEFITSLFPQSPLYASLLEPEVRALIGQVGEETKGVKRMLEAIGFEYSGRIDPFDGGPHFEAVVEDITLVKGAKHAEVASRTMTDEEEQAELARKRGAEEHLRPAHAPVRALVGRANPEGPCRFRAVQAAAVFAGHEVVLSPSTKKLLGVTVGVPVWAVPV